MRYAAGALKNLQDAREMELAEAAEAEGGKKGKLGLSIGKKKSLQLSAEAEAAIQKRLQEDNREAEQDFLAGIPARQLAAALRCG